jgi:hypothetical protein
MQRGLQVEGNNSHIHTQSSHSASASTSFAATGCIAHLLYVIFSLHHGRHQPPSQIPEPQTPLMVVPLAALLPREVATPRKQPTTHIA